MATTGDFDLYYDDNPWSVVDKNQRVWYDPELIAKYRQQALFTPTIQFMRNLYDVRTTKMVVTQLLDPHPDTTALAVRQIWMPASHLDSRSVEITFSRYGGKVAYNFYDDIVTYWRQNNQEGIRQITRGALGNHMIDVLDLLARNAYLKGAIDSGFVLYQGAGSSFNSLAITDLFNVNTGMDIWLGMAQRGVAAALGAAGANNNIICYTSPSVIYDIQKATGGGSAGDQWITINQYANPTALLKYEVGSYKQIRFVQSPKLCLWNCGEVVAQGLVDAAINAGDGAPAPGTTKVDNTYMVGQTTGAIKNYVSIGSWDVGSIASISVNDIVSIHTTRTSAYGVTNGVDPFEGTLTNRRVTAKGATTLVFDQPIMVDMNTNLGSGVYAYVTKGRNIHGSIFVGGNDGIVSGVAIPPRYHAPQAIDDFESVQRFSWDAYMGYQTYAPEVFEVVFSSGTTRIKGAAGVQ